MGKVSGNWITGTHSGRACKHEDIYTKVNKKTGACYSVKLCHPSEKVSSNQITERNAFGLVSAALSAWIKTNKASDSADYQKVKKSFDAQTKYATLRGFMMAKGMYTVSDAVSGTGKVVTVDITARTDFKTAFGIESGTAGSSGTGSGGNGNSQQVVKRTLTLSANPSDGGTVTGAGQYDNGTSVNISAVANSGYVFTKWNDGVTSASRTILMDADKSLNAIFATTAGGEVITNPDENEEGDHR